MSKDLNKVQITGRLGKDPEIRITPQGTTVTEFTVASNRSWKSADGQGRDDTEWFTVIAWNKLGEICGEYLRKGSRVHIEGRLQTRSWEDQESGQKRYKTEVIANDMIMLDAKRDVDPFDEPPPSTSARPTQSVADTRSRPAVRPHATGAIGRERRPSAPIEDDEDLPF